ncbi:MAG: BzdV protein, partial [Dehalococcoidia bacterium]
GFAEVELGFDEELAVEEARRCLRCELRLQISPVVLPPEKWLEFTPENVSAVPEIEGVFQLLDEEKNIIFIAGRANMRQGLEEQLAATEPPLSTARYFGYEENPMYTARESELIQQFLQEHGRMPEGNEEDLF